MDISSPSSPRRDDAAPQGEDLENIVSQMEWDDEYSGGVQFGNNEYDVDAVSRDDDDPRIGQGAWVDGKWHDPLDPHPVQPRESHSRKEFDPDYEPKAHQVMYT
jgi:hypothetical protein